MKGCFHVLLGLLMIPYLKMLFRALDAGLGFRVYHYLGLFYARFGG